MRRSIYSGAVVATTFITAALMSTGGAYAACVFTEWENVMSNHALPHITGRLCDGTDMALNVVGANPQGQVYDFGWSEASMVSTGSYTAEFVDANASNNILIDINSANNTMRATIDTQVAGGGTTTWYADYTMTGTR